MNVQRKTLKVHFKKSEESLASWKKNIKKEGQLEVFQT